MTESLEFFVFPFGEPRILEKYANPVVCGGSFPEDIENDALRVSLQYRRQR
jgi:hypothetical protein